MATSLQFLLDWSLTNLSSATASPGGASDCIGVTRLVSVEADAHAIITAGIMIGRHLSILSGHIACFHRRRVGQGPLRAPSPSKNRTCEFPRIRLKHLKGRSKTDPVVPTTGQPLRYYPGRHQLWNKPEEGVHRRVVEPPPSPICFPRLRCSPYSLAKRHQSDVCSLSCRVTLKPVSAPLQDGIRFFRPPKPAPP